MEIILLLVWAWGAYEGWKKLTEQNNEWLNTKEPLNIVVKLAICVVLGFVFFVIKSVQIGLRIAQGIFGA